MAAARRVCRYREATDDGETAITQCRAYRAALTAVRPWVFFFVERKSTSLCKFSLLPGRDLLASRFGASVPAVLAAHLKRRELMTEPRRAFCYRSALHCPAAETCDVLSSRLLCGTVISLSHRACPSSACLHATLCARVLRCTGKTCHRCRCSSSASAR